MIIQTASSDMPRLIITQIDHARLSGAFAAAFGNDQFDNPEPLEPMVFVAAHHDDGWGPTDDAYIMDEKTGLPYHLTQTPLTELLKTSVGSPAANEAHHPYSGLMSSMHTYGLFNGRYGLSDKIFIDLVAAEYRPAMQQMLDDELARQSRIKEELRGWDEMTPFISDNHLFTNYKLLQFFDTLALYFHMTHPEGRGRSNFLNVPQKVGQDVEIIIEPLGEKAYRLTPYPFSESRISFSYRGRYLGPQPVGTDLKCLLESTPYSEEVFHLVK